ncbi:globoside alpha-1,3-N-acetylgalactosaminyltransferase 1-like isoform X2 [Thalassophryne amazonica]|nr:globoside alpha-1,3-N-acetylgalactosaminyltransferase 1-like isoform X2 [Thalassophryne amazonica]
MEPLHPIIHGYESGEGITDVAAAQAFGQKFPLETPWGAPLVWGDTSNSAWRRAKFAQEGIHTGLVVLVIGTYAQFLRRFLSSAEMYFLPGRKVTYYILTDNPHSVEPHIALGHERKLKVVPVAELPGWDRLAHRRMALLADAIRNPIHREVEYIFCADIDQEFVAPVGEEILCDLVATLHPELYGMPRKAYPYEIEEVSSAFVGEDEGDYYYTSELYGGSVTKMYSLTRACSLLILQDQANGVVARGLEESYLNHYLIDHRPTCVLSPEYSWWDSALTADVPVQRLISLGRQCGALDEKKREQRKC